MVWSTPPFFPPSTMVTSTQLNILSACLNETAVGKATTAGRHFTAAGTTSLAERACTSTLTTASEDSASTTFTNLATVGPTVSSVTVSANMWVTIYASMLTSAAGGAALMGYEISGASTVAADDARSIASREPLSQRFSMMMLHTSLTAGSHTVTGKYRVTAGTGTWNDRRCAVFPL